MSLRIFRKDKAFLFKLGIVTDKYFNHIERVEHTEYVFNGNKTRSQVKTQRTHKVKTKKKKS